MADQFLVPLVGVVRRMKKCFGIAGVNGNGNADTAAFLPDGIQSGIIHRDELAALVPHAQAEVFQHFQSACTTGYGIIQLRDHLLTEVRVIDLAPVVLREHHEAAGMGLDHFIQYGLQLVPPHAG